jgi:outer membrane protein TolC
VYNAENIPAAVEMKPISQQIVNLPEKGPLKITVKDAILIAFQNNRSLLVERINPSIRKTYEEQERAVFDPTLDAELSDQRNDSMSLNQSGSYTVNSVNDVLQGSISLKDIFPTGTFVEITAVTKTTDSDQYSEQYSSTRLGLSVTQSLLQGYGTIGTMHFPGGRLKL